MHYKHLDLSAKYRALQEGVYLTIYAPSLINELNGVRKRPAVILIPGGAYAYVSEREGEPVALRLLNAGFNVFLLTYNVGPYSYPNPLLEGFAALLYVKEHAEIYSTDTNKIAIMGFSAGGHFAASLAAYQENKEIAALLGAEPSLLTFNGLLLSYPVISMKHKPHEITKQNITKSEKDLISKYSIEDHVSANFPKTFIWTTDSDTVVSSEHSLLLATALKKQNIPFELHYYPFGDHGLSLADASVFVAETDPNFIAEISYIKEWINLAIKFIKDFL